MRPFSYYLLFPFLLALANFISTEWHCVINIYINHLFPMMQLLASKIINVFQEHFYAIVPLCMELIFFVSPDGKGRDRLLSSKTVNYYYDNHYYYYYYFNMAKVDRTSNEGLCGSLSKTTVCFDWLVLLFHFGDNVAFWTKHTSYLSRNGQLLDNMSLCIIGLTKKTRFNLWLHSLCLQPDHSV